MMPIIFVKACGIFSRYVKRSTARIHIYVCMYANEARHEGRGGGEGPQRGPVKLRIPPPRETSISIKSC